MRTLAESLLAPLRYRPVHSPYPYAGKPWREPRLAFSHLLPEEDYPVQIPFVYLNHWPEDMVVIAAVSVSPSVLPSVFRPPRNSDLGDRRDLVNSRSHVTGHHDLRSPLSRGLQRRYQQLHLRLHRPPLRHSPLLIPGQATGIVRHSSSHRACASAHERKGRMVLGLAHFAQVASPDMEKGRHAKMVEIRRHHQHRKQQEQGGQ